LQQTIVMRCEEITQLASSNNELKKAWNQMTTADSTLRAQPNFVVQCLLLNSGMRPHASANTFA
jgi:hypothetical protein